MARTAVVAGTATAVSNRVSRRQANKWQQQEQPQYQAPPPQPQYQAPPQPQYQPPPQPQYQAPPQPQYQAPPAPAPAADDSSSLMDDLEQLAAMKAQGLIDEAEYSAAKAKLLGI